MGAAAPAIGAGTGLLSLLLGAHQNSEQNSQANSANSRANALAARQTALFDTLSGIVTQQDRSGAFDPTRKLNLLKQDTDFQEKEALGNEGAAARTLGYRPGDSAPLQDMNATQGSFALNYANQANSIRDQANRDRLNAYESINSGALNPGLANDQFQSGQAYSRMQDPSKFLSAFMQSMANMHGGGSSGMPMDNSSLGNMGGDWSWLNNLGTWH